MFSIAICDATTLHDQSARRLAWVASKHLKSVEAARLGDLNLRGKALAEVLVDDPVRSRKEGENVLQEIPLVVVELLVPLLHVLAQINLLRGPEAGLGLLVHFPHGGVLEGKQDEPFLVLLKDGLGKVGWMLFELGHGVKKLLLAWLLYLASEK